MGPRRQDQRRCFYHLKLIYGIHFPPHDEFQEQTNASVDPVWFMEFGYKSNLVPARIRASQIPP